MSLLLTLSIGLVKVVCPQLALRVALVVGRCGGAPGRAGGGGNVFHAIAFCADTQFHWIDCINPAKSLVVLKSNPLRCTLCFERGGHDFELFGNPPKISKLGLILGGKAAKNNIAADSPPARPSARRTNRPPTPRSAPAAQHFNRRLSTHADWQAVVN